MYIRQPLALLQHIGKQRFPKPASNAMLTTDTLVTNTSLEKLNKGGTFLKKLVLRQWK